MQGVEPVGRLDITLVSGCRPKLLGETLQSFQARMFRHFEIGSVFVNIDPIMGDRSDGDACEALIRSYFPKAEVTRPAQPGFGAAVKTVWQATGERPVFHLEDDWLLNADLTPETVYPLLGDPTTGMVQPSIQPRAATSGEFLTMVKRRRVFGLEYHRSVINSYGTSPRFFRPGLARLFGSLIDPRMDPEKQVYKKKNPRLSRAHEPWRCRLLFCADGGPMITDIGRDWRADRGIRKIDRNGYATWVTKA